MAFCKECGHKMKDGELFCTECGTKNSDPYDLDITETIIGDYAMPGTAGYVPVSEIKVHRSENVLDNEERLIVEREMPLSDNNIKRRTIAGEGLVDEFDAAGIPINEVLEAVEEVLSDAPDYIPKESAENFLQDEVGYTFPRENANQQEYSPPGGNVQQEYVPPGGSVQQEYTPPRGNVQQEYSQPGGNTQQEYTPPGQGYTPNYQSSNTPPPKKSGLPIPAIIGGVVVVFAILFFIFGGKGKDNGDIAGNDILLGRWNAFAGGAGDYVFDLREDEEFGELYVEFKKNNSIMVFFEEENNGEYEEHDGEYYIETEDGTEFIGTLEDGVFTLSTRISQYYFLKEGAKETAKAKEILALASEENYDDEIEDDYGESVITKEYWEGDWYGVYIESSNWGDYETDEPLYLDMYGDIGIESSTGKHYFEAYFDGDESPFISMYIDLYDEYFEADIGDEDAWIGGRYLEEKEESRFRTEYKEYPPTIQFSYKYIEPEDPDSGYEFLLTMRKDGESWDDQNIKPPGME